MNKLQVWTVDESGRQELIGTIFVDEDSGETVQAALDTASICWPAMQVGDYFPIVHTLPDGTFRADHEEVISTTRH